MTRAQTREYLLRARRAGDEAARYLALQQQAQTLMNGLPRTAQETAYVDTLRGKLGQLMEDKRRLVCAIDRLSDPRHRMLLLAYYVEGLTWERVAEEMRYTYQNVVQFLHPKALDALGAVLECGMDTEQAP